MKMTTKRTAKTRPAPWTTTRKTVKTTKTVKRIRPVSKCREQVNKEYRKAAKTFVESAWNCEVPKCWNRAKEVHHVRGRAGSLLMDRRYWLAVCPACHKWIHANPALAKKAGLLAKPGKWGNTK